MTPPELLNIVLSWVALNWATLSILFAIAAAAWRVGRLMDRTERDNRIMGKLLRLHALMHPNHAGILYNPELTAKDINPDAVTQCDAKPRRGPS